MLAPFLNYFSSFTTSHGQRWDLVLNEPRDLSWYSFLVVLLSCANQFKVNYLRLCAWNLLHRKLCWCSLLFSKPFKDIIIKKTPQYENESQWLLKRPTVHSLIASRELSLIWRRFCLFQILCQSLTYTTFPTPKKIHKSAQRPPKYKFNREKWFACFVFQLKVFVILILIYHCITGSSAAWMLW